MSWPWVSRGRLEDAQERIRELREDLEREREQVKELQESIVRIGRRQAGMSEEPREPRPRLEPMPREIHEYIDGFANPSIRKQMRDQLYRRHGAGTGWGEMMAEIPREEENGHQTQ